ncbi:Rieske 2Fe-2S domain-containing protein [Pseudonocardia endophytica]|uniref:Ferredoxin-NADP reductase n=1 Tax=Pseudonocardia endophytica TaxID=401976 RepID=A0A4R1HU12_PSEEN|nr:Rieske 2Fe-2S domain-containing protein [Pseudonocardia endophytica]TCK25738.1 ferredoxin-NADP reductase [Pseudonocardia endophytica]
MTRYAVAGTSEIGPGQRKIVEIEGRPVGVLNVDGEYFALLDRCPHAGAPLCGHGTIFGVSTAAQPDGPIEYEGGRSLRCPWHAWEFDVRTGVSFYDPRNARVRRYPVEVVAGAPDDVVEPDGGRQEGPLVLEGYEVAVEGDMLVVDTARRRPGRTAVPPRPADEPVDVVAVVAAKRAAAAGVAVVELRSRDGTPMPAWTPGAHLEVTLTDDLVRHYSLCGAPDDRSTWRIGVLREQRGRGGSAYVHDTLQVGDEIRCHGPRNNFALEKAREYVFLAGGIGITPILPMIAECEASGQPWRLVYGGRSRSSMAFLEEVEAYGDRVTIWPHDERGHLDLPAALGEPRDGVAVYCCGPGPLIDAVEGQCAPWPAGTLHVERFRPADGALDGPDTAFEVVCDRSDLVVGVPEGRSVVDALADAGVHVPTSCREGTCGTCETVVLDGVPDHRDSFLSPSERASNEVMTPCCSRSHGPRLVLDL